MEKRHPHWDTLWAEQPQERFEDVVCTIWERGYDRWYLRRKWRSLDVGDRFYIWVCTEPTGPDAHAPLDATILINRALRVQDRLL
jgi:hypothetical protein